MLVRVERLDRARPRTHVLVEEGGHTRDRVEVEMAPDVSVREAGAQEERGRLQRAARDDHCLRSDRDGFSRPRDRVDTVRAAAPRDDAFRACLDDDPRACRVCVLEPRDEGRLLRAQLAAEAAVPAHAVLVTTAHVARHRVDVPTQRLEAASHDRVARGRLVVVRANTRPLSDHVETVRELVAYERAAPLVAHRVGGREGGRPVERRRPAETFAGQ